MSRLTKSGFRLLLLAGVSVVWTSSPPPVRGQDPQRPAASASLESRVRELEETIRQMQANAVPGVLPGAALAPAPQNRQPVIDYPTLPTESGNPQTPQDGSSASTSGSGAGDSAKDKDKDKDGKSDSTPVAGWNEGFFLRSKDRNYQLRITGQIQADYREFLDIPNDPLEVDTFLLRRARFGLEADMFKYYEFRFLPDFGQGTAVVQDCYMNVHYVDWLQLETGKFKQPFSYEQLIQDRFIPTCERSLVDQLVPARDVGAMVHGQKLFGDRLDFYAAVSNGEINGSFDVNENKDLAGRLVVRPLNGLEFIPLVRLFQVGISGSIGVEQEAIMPASLKTPATVTWLQFNTGVRADGRRERWSRSGRISSRASAVPRSISAWSNRCGPP
jgi:phosphate-selective porin OprO/OprP